MISLFDQPFSIAVATAAVVFLLGIFWVQTGKNAFLFAMGAALVLGGLLLVLERQVITDREAVTATLYEIAALLEKNDVDAISQRFVQSRPEWAKRVRDELPRYAIQEARITQIHEIELSPEHQPPQAIVEFNVSVTGQIEQYPARNLLRWVRVKFWKEDDGVWRVADYEHDEPTHFMRKREPMK